MLVGTLVLTLFLAAVVLALSRTQFSLRTANDVLPFLRTIDMEVAYGTFHPRQKSS